MEEGLIVCVMREREKSGGLGEVEGGPSPAV